jgi:hypothetical protein
LGSIRNHREETTSRQKELPGELLSERISGAAMLSHTDVHYLTGLLQVATSPNPVEVELGSMVFDEAAEVSRDVDVTVRYQSEHGVPSAISGIEVKDHGRPLDVTHVEQLAAKLADMTALGKRGIVSASGYTESAIRKATARDIHLYALENWDPHEDVFPTNFTALNSLSEQTILWEKATILFNPDEDTSPELQRALEGDCPLVGEDGTALGGLPNKKALIDLVARQTLDNPRTREALLTVPAGIRSQMTFDVELCDRPCVRIASGLKLLASARISGHIYFEEKRHDMSFWRLISITDGVKPIAGCGLVEMENGDLMGLSTNNLANRGKLSVIRINATDRTRVVIRRQILR